MTIRKGVLVYIRERQVFWQVRFGIVENSERTDDKVLVRYFFPNHNRSYMETSKLIPLVQVNPEIKSLTQILKRYGHLIVQRLAEAFN